ncbi:MAG: hypothetical protein AAGA01_05500 [Cyanobacteria bacterium P01_E01_bin.43]
MTQPVVTVRQAELSADEVTPSDSAQIVRLSLKEDYVTQMCPCY